MRILVVEDDRRLASIVRRGLEERAYAVDVAERVEEALEKVGVNGYDLVVLDRRLPDGDGAEVARSMRRDGIVTPVLMLTARDAIEDRVEGLDAGADDYLVKPFAFPELAARVRALMRRDLPGRVPALAAGVLRLDPAAHVASHAGRTLRLAPREFAVLEYLMRRAGEVVRRSEIEEHCWEGDFEAFSNVVDVHVARLRRATGGATSPIETVRGVGYRLRADPPEGAA